MRKYVRSGACVCALAWGVGLGLPLAAQDEADPMAAMMKLAAPGEHHRHMAKLAGEWKAVSKMWLDPAAAPVESTGTMQLTPILGGRFMQSQYKGPLMGMEFNGIGLDGFDNQKQKHIGLWVDNMGTMMMTFEGACSDGGKVTTTMSDFVDPASGQATTMKSVTTMIDDKKFMFEGFARPASGGEFFKTMEITYTR